MIRHNDEALTLIWLAALSVSNCCGVAIDVPEYDETNENAPQNFGIYHCPKCGNDCGEVIE